MLRMVSSRGRKTMMSRMMIFRRRKTMMMLRRRTDPKIRAPTLCEPAHAKCSPTCHMSHCVQTCTEKMYWPRRATHILCKPVQPTCTPTFSQEALYADMYR